MDHLNETSLQRMAYVPLQLTGRPIALKAMVVVLGTCFLTASSWVQVPMFPVPMTMQTFAVLMVGALCGWRLGAVTVLAWLAEAFFGLPVLSEGAFGPAVFVGTTGGYLAAFPIMAAVVGWLAERGWTVHFPTTLATLLLGEVICFALGLGWLAHMIGGAKAIEFGLMPFVYGEVVKWVLAAVAIEAARRAMQTRSSRR
jgi:biotin transport system substrate-specific component